MNILVHGAGALGAYFGGRILEAGQNVSFFVREKRAAQLKKEGLNIYSPEGNFERKDITVYTTIEEVEHIDLVILAVKGYHLDTSHTASRSNRSKDGRICAAIIKWYGASGKTTENRRKRKSVRGICLYHRHVK